MRVLGISYGYHDSSVTLVEDGEVVEYLQEERLTNIKHDPAFPAFAIGHCLKNRGLTFKDIDHVTFHEDPYQKFSRVFCSSVAGFPATSLEFVESNKEWLKKKLWALSHIQDELALEEKKLSYFSHHFSHALTAFMGSGFDECAILVVDAVGDWSCSSMYRGRWDDGAPVVEVIEEVPFPNSLGLVYSAVTAYLGFNPNDGECSTMALSSFGNPTYVEDFREILGVGKDGHYAVDLTYFNFIRYFSSPVSAKFTQRFGPPKPPELKYKFDSLKSLAEQDATEDEQRYADVACSLQLVFEEIVLQLTRTILQKVQTKNLAYAGGCALNCKLNSFLLRELPGIAISIPFDPGDGGTSMGTAQYVAATDGKSKFFQSRKRLADPYIGLDAKAEEVIDALPFFKPQAFSRYGVEALSATTCDDDEMLAQKVAELIDQDKIVGWYQGRAEAGPRALGHRSILIKAGNLELARKLSRKVKERASFRPYALSVLDSEANRLFEEPESLVAHGKWMQYILKVRDAFTGPLRAGLHVDLTTRAHICREADNPTFYKLLRHVQRRSGYGAVINTSFNPSGYPIVGGGSYALSMFLKTEMDVLVMGHTIIEKKR